MKHVQQSAGTDVSIHQSAAELAPVRIGVAIVVPSKMGYPETARVTSTARDMASSIGQTNH